MFRFEPIVCLVAFIVGAACSANSARVVGANSIAPFNHDSVTRDSTGRRLAAVVGAVADSAGSPLEGSQILLKPTTGSRPYVTYTNRRGGFVIARVEPGSYEVLIRRLGFAPHVEQRTLRASVVDTVLVRIAIYRPPPCDGIGCY